MSRINRLPFCLCNCGKRVGNRNKSGYCHGHKPCVVCKTGLTKRGSVDCCSKQCAARLMAQLWPLCKCGCGFRTRKKTGFKSGHPLQKRQSRRGSSPRYKEEDIFVLGHDGTFSLACVKIYYVRKRKRDGVIHCDMEDCHLLDWKGKPIVLQLDHINGNRYDNRLENLRLLCPNCHSQTDTFCGKNKNSYVGKLDGELPFLLR